MIAFDLGFGLGCSTALTSFVCQQNEDCSANEGAGRCEDTMFCSFSDPSCPSKFRYGTASGTASNMCTDEVIAADAAGPDIVDAGTPDPTIPLGIPSIGLSLGRGHSCVLLEEQFSVASDKKSASICWGNNASGQLGPSVQIANDGEPLLTHFNSKFNEDAATGIAAGRNTTCRYNDDAFECFGDEENARLGPGTSAAYILDDIDVGPGAQSAVCLTGVNRQAMIPVSDPLYCWGINTFGLIAPDMGPTSTLYQAPTRSFLSDENFDIDAFGVGEKHICVLTREPGVSSKITCWGNTEQFQLARATVPPVVFGGPATTVFRKTDIAMPNDPVHLGVGYNHTCIIDSLGQPFCWGDNSSQQSNPTSMGEIVAEATQVAGVGKNAMALSLGKSHTCIIAINTQVYCWGSGSLGQIGQGPNTNIPGNPVVESRGKPLTGVDRIESGQDHTCAHVPGTGVYCWGLNDEHQVDTTSTARHFSAILSYAESE